MAADARAGGLTRRPDAVVLCLLAAGAAGFLLLPVLTAAPNRLLDGEALALGHVLGAGRATALLPAAALLFFAAAGRRIGAAISAWGLIAGLVWLAGTAAAAVTPGLAPAARIAPGAGWWAAALAAGLIWSETLRALPPALRLPLLPTPLLPVVVLYTHGRLAALSLLREYAARRAEVGAAVAGHVVLVGLTLAIALPAGAALGLLAQRRAALRGPVFTTLNVVQTIPSIALFGLLLPALAPLGAGIGRVPAVIALVLYALLPLARATAEGLDGVDAGIVEAARGIGMPPVRRLWTVEAPLAAPALLAGVRVTVVQTIGLAVIAALIGAGGLGALVFAGLSADALDLVLLGVIPTVALAVIADATLRLLAGLARR